MPKPDRKRAQRVYIREPTNRDGPQIIAANQISRTLHRGWVAPPTHSQAFTKWMTRCRQPNVKCLLVCRSDDEAIVGVFVVSEIVRGLFQSAYLGFYAEQPHGGQGYMTEAMRLVLRHAFTDMGLHRIEANVQPENVASLALVKRSGFRLEGFSPRYLKVAGRWRDHQRWAMTIDDWRRFRQSRPAPSRYRAHRSPPASSSPGRPRSG